MTELLSKIFIREYKKTDNPHVRQKYGNLSSIVGISVNILLALIKLLLGTVTLSTAVIADALNNLSDAGSSIIMLISFKLSVKPPDRDHPFGHARIEYVASMVVSFLILLVGFETLTDACSALFGFSESKPSNFSLISILILATSILFKLWLSVFYRKIGNKINSSVIKASSVDALTDCISTVAVLISAVIVRYTELQFVDSVTGIIVSCMIMVAGIKILNETKNSLLGEAPLDSKVADIKKIVEAYPEIIGVHDLLLHNYGPNRYFASFHAEVDGTKDIFMLHDMIDNVEKRIYGELGILCTIHLDPIVTDNDMVNELKSFILKIVHNEISENVDIHDFRAVIGNTHTNLIFDIVIPYENKSSDETIVKRVSDAVSDLRSDCYCVITVDRG